VSDLTDVKIANMALSRIGSRIAISALSGTTTVENIEANRFFLSCRDRVLAEVDWPFASKFADLAGKIDATDTAGDDTNVEADWKRVWAFAYTYPSDAISIREFITAEGRMPAAKVAYDIGLHSGALKVFTDLDSADEDVTIRYTYQCDNYALWTHLAGSAFAWLLAAELCNVLPVDPEKGNRALQMYEREKLKAIAAARNEKTRDDSPDGDFMAARG